MSQSSVKTPERFGDFEILREAGRGGMGVVYEARQISLNRRVALKVMNAPLGLTPQGVQRFHREAEAAARLHHSNIVPIHASGESEGVPYYAMELIEGPSLDRVIKQLRGGKPEETPVQFEATTSPHQSLTPVASPSGSSHLSTDIQFFDQVARLIAGVADGLDHAHKNGVIHRDIKPSNLLLTSDGRLTINDFGLARVLEQPGMTTTGEFVGTPSYMSPEQITAGRTPLDHRTDIYSLGATLYELIALQPPFVGESRDQVLAQIIHKEPKPPRRFTARAPVDLETICLKALDKDPDRRYQSAGDMADDLRRYLNRFAISARRTGPLGQMKKWAKRHPGLAAALVSAVLLACVAGGFAYRSMLLERDRIAEQQKRDEERRRHEEELRQEKIRAALDKALLLAMGGEFDGAEAAVRESEQLGPAAGEAHLVRSQIAFFQGDIPKAQGEIQQAVEMLPNSVAARSLRALIYVFEGREDRYLAELRVIEAMQATAPDELLWKGYAIQIHDTTRALEYFDEALRIRPTVVGRMMRGEVRAAHLAQLNLTVEGAETAVEDAVTARYAMPGKPLIISNCVKARLMAIHAHEAAGNLVKAKEHLARAQDDCRELKQLGDGPDGSQARWHVLRLVGEQDTLIPELRKSAQDGNPVVLVHYALTLIRRGEAASAISELEKHKGIVQHDILRAISFAELPDGRNRAFKVYEEIAATKPSSWDAYNSLFVLFLVGKDDVAASAARELLKQPDRLPLLKPEQIRLPLRFVSGQLNESDFLKEAAATSGGLCNAHLTVALSRLARGDRIGAKQHLKACLETGVFYFFPFGLAWAIFGRMEKDPMWPNWIPAEE